MLGRKYLIANGERLPTPTTPIKIKKKNRENVITSEAGTDIVDIIRLQKRTVTCSFQVSSRWKKKLEDLADETTVFLGIGTTELPFKCRPRMTSCDLFDGSQEVAGTDGLWTISMTFEEV